MASKTALGKKPVAATPRAPQARRELWWAAGGLVFLLVVSLGFFVGYNPRLRRTLLGNPYYDLTVLHTNDTWGYTEPCG